MNIKRNLKENKIEVQTQSIDDIWVIHKILESSDQISGQTTRKIKIGDQSTDRNVKTTIKKVYLQIQAEKNEYEPSLHQLRITGPISHGTDEIPNGEYHSFLITDNTKITIQKTKWHSFQIEKLEEATKESQSLLICLCDREQALYSLHTKQGFKHLSQITGNVTKKDEEQKGNENFYHTIIQHITEYNDKYKPNAIIIGTPTFYQQYLNKELKETNLKVSYTDIAEINENGLDQLTQESLFEQLNKSKPVEQVFEEILQKISTEKPATYGYDHVLNAANMGQVEIALIANSAIAKYKEDDNMQAIETLISAIEQTKGKVIIVEEENHISKKLEGLSGFIAILRF